MPDPLTLTQDFAQIQQHIEQAWQRLTSASSHRPQYSPVYAPPTDVFETPEGYLIFMEIAGLAGEHVEVQADGERVTIRGNRVDRRNPLAEPQRVLQLEVPFGPFERTLLLPSETDASLATATYRDGFLQIKLPKLAQRRQYHVRIVICRER